jgi:hypothetical protein
VVSWFLRRVPPVAVPQRWQRPRTSGRSTRASFGAFSVEVLPFLGQVTYVSLVGFEQLVALMATAPDLAIAEKLGPSVEVALATQRTLAAQIRHEKADPADIMRPFSAEIDRYYRSIAGADWNESLLAGYLTTGLLNDLFRYLIVGLPPDRSAAIAHLFTEDSLTEGSFAQDSREQHRVELLTSVLSADTHTVSRLALWGRRLVGDTLLLARSIVHSCVVDRDSVGSVTEMTTSMTTEMLAAHTRRMDALGFTA